MQGVGSQLCSAASRPRSSDLWSRRDFSPLSLLRLQQPVGLCPGQGGGWGWGDTANWYLEPGVRPSVGLTLPVPWGPSLGLPSLPRGWPGTCASHSVDFSGVSALPSDSRPVCWAQHLPTCPQPAPPLRSPKSVGGVWWEGPLCPGLQECNHPVVQALQAALSFPDSEPPAALLPPSTKTPSACSSSGTDGLTV